MWKEAKILVLRSFGIVVVVFVFQLGGQSWAIDPLEQVELDQASGLQSSDDIFNQNHVLNSRRDLTRASSYKNGRFAWYAHDGDEKTAWVPDPKESGGSLEISWGLAEPIDRILVREKKPQGIQSLRLELYDGKHWEEISPISPKERGQFQFAPRSASAVRLSLATSGSSSGIAEVEVYNTQRPAPLARFGSPGLLAAMQKSEAVVLFDGSPYGYSRAGRTRVSPRDAEACLSDDWTRAVLLFVCESLEGKVDRVEEDDSEADRISTELNGQTFTFTMTEGHGVIEQVGRLAERAGLEWLQQGPLVLVGQGLEALKQKPILAELETLLGQNPFLIKARPEGVADAVVTPSLTQEGTTYEWAGFRATAIPGTNTDAWLKYAETQAVRTWVGAPRYMDMYIRPQETVDTAADFERLKAALRAAPEENDIVAMRAFLNKHHEALAGEFSVYQSLGIEVINQTGAKTWPDTIHDDFINWASCYVLTYYLAKNFDVAAHQYGNEPDWYFDQSTDEQVRRRLTLIADAVHSAIDDVNRDHHRALTAIFSAPVLASDFQGRNARIMMQTLHTRYDGTESSDRLFQLFNRHRYSGRPHQNALEVRQAKQMMQEEAGEVLPQVFTELNFATGRYWGRPTTTFTNDTPAVFSAMAGIWGWMLEEQGVYGIFVFKFSDPGVWSWNNTGPFSNTVTYSMHREQDPDGDDKEHEQISYGTKNFEVCRLFSKGFHGGRPLLKTDVACSDPEYRSWTTYDEESQRFFIWSTQPSDFQGYEIEFDFSRLNIPHGALVTAELVSGARHGEVICGVALPASQKLRLHQPPKSGMLITIQAQPLTHEVVSPVADATVQQGDQAETNFGHAPQLSVGRHSQSDQNRMSFLKFQLPDEPAAITHAMLQLHGQSISRHAYDGGFLFRVYAVSEDAWTEEQLTAANAPNVFRTVSALKQVDLEHYPVGHATCFHEPSDMGITVTQAVQEAQRAGREHLSLVLIREQYWPGEQTDDVSAVFAARESGGGHGPALHLWKERPQVDESAVQAESIGGR